MLHSPLDPEFANAGLNWKGDALFKFSCQSEWYGTKSRNEKSLGFGSRNKFSPYPSANQDVITVDWIYQSIRFVRNKMTYKSPFQAEVPAIVDTFIW